MSGYRLPPDVAEFLASWGGRGSSTRSRWLYFHFRNPRIHELFTEFTFDLIRAKFQHYGARDIIGRIRWHVAVSTEEVFINPDDPEGRPLKLNDHHAAHYARLFMQEYPEHDGFFRIRALKSEGDDELIEEMP